jgi:SAM-dependent methyltransferase
VYWRSRRTSAYYREVVRLANEYGKEGGSVLDVGAHETKVLSQLPRFPRRVALDRGKVSPQKGVETIRANFLKWEPVEHFDLVLCLQVLEHIPNAQEFARRLFAAGDTVIVSVPYRWPRGKCKFHIHDPVDDAKLREWTGRDPSFSVIVNDESERLIAVYVPVA